MEEVNSMERVKQTYKTLILEEFNADAELPTLYDLLNNIDMDKVTSEILGEDVKKLEVHSFKEFLEKFAPKVYEVCLNINDKPQFFYTTDKDKIKNQYAVEKKITEQSYYKMLSQMYMQKGSSGESNLLFDDKDILEMLTPQKEIEEARSIRRKMKFNLDKYYECEAKGENSAEYAQKFIECRKKIADTYSGSQSAMIPLVLEDTRTKLNYLKTAAANNETDDTGEQIGLLGNGSGSLGIDSSGRMVVVQQKATEELPAVEEKPQKDTAHEIATIIERDYDQTAVQTNGFVKDLVLSIYSPMQAAKEISNIKNEDLEEACAKYTQIKESYEDVYCQAKEAFITEMTQVISKLLGVKTFFDHAVLSGGEEGKLKEGVLIANCKASKLIQEEVKDKFAKFICHRGKDLITGKIWFAVLPGIVERDVKKGGHGTKNPADPFGALGDFVQTENLPENTDFVSLGAAKSILEIMDKGKILTVFNLEANENNGFTGISADYIKGKKDKLSAINSGHAVFAYPNFTLMRERKVPISKEDGARRILVQGVYLDAAYTAAGLLAASQQGAYLEKHGFQNRVNKQNVCVHVDLENVEVKKNLLTKFNRESTLRWSQDIRETINEDMFGFVFCGDEVYDGPTLLKNTYVYCARTLKKYKGIYKPIYQVLMEDFIYVYLQTKLSRKVSDIKNFISQDVRVWKNESKQQKGMNNINLILKENEDILWDDEQKKIKIKFDKDESVLEDITIDSDE